MINKILPFINKLLPVNIAYKGLGKVDPRLGDFFTNALAAGYPLHSAMGFFRDQFQPVEAEAGERPDQTAARARVKQGKAAGKGALTAAATAASLPLAGSIINSFTNGQQQSKQSQGVAGGMGVGSGFEENPNTNVPSGAGVGRFEETDPNELIKENPKAQPQKQSASEKNIELVMGRMFTAGEEPEDIAEYIRGNYPEYADKLEKNTGLLLEDIILNILAHGGYQRPKKTRAKRKTTASTAQAAQPAISEPMQRLTELLKARRK